MPRYFPDRSGFAKAAETAQIIPVYRQLLSDGLTPVGAFALLSRDEHAFLLESVVGGEQIARYSFIAAGPRTVYQVSGGQATITESGKSPRQFRTTDPLADLAGLMPKGVYHRSGDLPAFTGGLVGYAGYDTVRYYEGEKLPNPPKDDRKLPDLLMGLYAGLGVFDY